MAQKDYIRIHESDNVGVAIADLVEGDYITGSDGETIQINSSVAFGHKIALMDMKEGDSIVKYGAPMGRATVSIHKGEHVHVHNMESLYMKQFTK